MPYKHKDHLYNQAKSDGYRSRAAYKLLELDKKLRLIKPSMTVLDLGCSPGGWTQVLLEKLSNNGLVVAVDLEELQPFSLNSKIKKQPYFIKGDIASPDIQKEIMTACKATRPVFDLVLSDMSPKLTGITISDAVRSTEVVAMAISVAKNLLKPGGSFVAKIFPSQEAEELAKEIKQCFKTFSRQNLDSSRKTSNEFYFVARDFKG